ncbi:hypothetical protein KSF_074930 [Reticulibacter mediterranei]|uniref:Uncharacterized protein n=1 Tax=Reticulibacter mediterranei TaxID=2778369 RepID=A0A8J3IS04_9CHLR|nr:hypothetical protein [Reticulibacter mediterranei]GHO97445.1 hypothetical protein KSF_074930 [Reticulibacter mediterranei]
MDEIKVVFGGLSLFSNNCRIIDTLNAVSQASFHLEKHAFLGLGAVNYLDEVTIHSISQSKCLFTGNIISIKEEPNNEVVITLQNGIELTEKGVSALTVIGVDPPEQFYSLARLAGIRKEKLSVYGLNSSMKDMAAFIPFKGLFIEEDENVGEIQFLTRKSVQEQLPGVENQKSEVWKGFLDADGWISFRFQSAHFADAEEAATEKADVFLSAYSGFLQYGYSQFDGDFIAWERTRELVNLQRQDHLLLVMLHTGAIWLRDLSPYRPIQSRLLRPAINIDMKAVMDAGEEAQLPLLVWNRFRDSEDYYVVTIGLWQVFELLSSDDKLPKRFTKEQLKALIVSSHATANLTEESISLSKMPSRSSISER